MSNDSQKRKQRARIDIRSRLKKAYTIHSNNICSETASYELVISIINLSYVNFEYLKDLLGSFPTTFSTNTLVVITMVRPTKRQLEAICAFPLPIKVFARDHLLSFAENHNYVFQTFAADYYWMLNDDTKIVELAWERILSAFSRDDAVAVATPYVLNPDFTRQNIVNTRWGVASSILTIFDIHRKYRKLKELYYSFRHNGRRTPSNIQTIAGVAPFIRGKVFLRLGYMDEVTRYWGEDKEFFSRVTSARMKIVILADELIVHYGGVSTSVNRTARKERADFCVMRLIAVLNYIDKNYSRRIFDVFRYVCLVIMTGKRLLLGAHGEKDHVRKIILYRFADFIAARTRYGTGAEAIGK